ncbi:hypothetical protein VIC_004004 [Vibrio coralliilyticus ATCC BAA-450]|nr:hypothetical protein VIC_004004 [Vibrio coralliilyticus ATCC BAA-450]
MGFKFDPSLTIIRAVTRETNQLDPLVLVAFININGAAK